MTLGLLGTGAVSLTLRSLPDRTAGERERNGKSEGRERERGKERGGRGGLA